MDSLALSKAARLNILPGLALIAVILYVIAWNVTDVRLDRLVSRFNDARTVCKQSS